MADPSDSPEHSHCWSTEARAIAAQAYVLSGNKLEQLVLRLQRHSGRSNEACWRFVIQHGLKRKMGLRRWTQEEIEVVREDLVKHSVEEVAKKLNRTPKSIRSMLRRNRLGVREIRCDLFSIGSLAGALQVRKAEIHFWIKQKWLQASICTLGRTHSYSITPEALAQMYRHHLADLLKRGIRNQTLFEAYVQYVHSPKHTVVEQLLDVRRDKRERAAFATLHESGGSQHEVLEEDEDDRGEEYRVGFSGEGGVWGNQPTSSE